MSTLQEIEIIRKFNRLYPEFAHGTVGNLSSTESRILHEIALQRGIHAATITTVLALDPGYVSRILGQFVQKKLITRTPSRADRRQLELFLTAKGQKLCELAQHVTRDRIDRFLEQFPTDDRANLIKALRKANEALEGKSTDYSTILRAPKPGDIGWIIHRHGAMIAAEFGLDMRFESMAARIAADFIDRYDPAYERCFIAERSGQIAGSIFLVRVEDAIAQLRLLYVEPWARGSGLGRRLLDKSLRTARELGYQKVILWTVNGLDSARHLYEKLGFTLIEQSPHHHFTSTREGVGTLGQRWELALR